MKKAISIKLTRAEGTTCECSPPNSPRLCTAHPPSDAVERAGEDVWQDANRVLFSWSMTAPKNGGYHKCDFVVTYEDGETYEGRYDLTHHTVERPSLERHMRSFLDFHAGTYCPPHLTEERYREYLALSRIQAKAFLAVYEVGR